MVRPVNERPRWGSEIKDEDVIGIEFPAPAALMSMNDRMHHMAKAELTSAWRHATAMFARGIPALPPSIVRVSFRVRDPGRSRDPSNWYPTVKACVDGLVDAKLFPDDDSTWVATVEPQFLKSITGQTVCLVEIWSRKETA